MESFGQRGKKYFRIVQFIPICHYQLQGTKDERMLSGLSAWGAVSRVDAYEFQGSRGKIRGWGDLIEIARVFLGSEWRYKPE